MFHCDTLGKELKMVYLEERRKGKERMMREGRGGGGRGGEERGIGEGIGDERK